MNPPSGIYGVVGARAADADFAYAGLPAPKPIADGVWLASWAAGPHTGEIAHAGARWLAFHGRLHNAAPLARALDLAENTHVGPLLLRAWARWPDDWTARLDGLYAIASGTNDGALALRRDASGALGLFYARTRSGGVAFASHLGTLMRLPGVERRLSRAGLHEYLRMLDIAAPNTIFEAVRAVPAGEGVHLEAGRPTETVIPPRAFAQSDEAFDDAVTQLESALDVAIARRLDGTSRPAAFLSGGVDSALICALAARRRPDLHTLTVGFDGAAYDETPMAEAIAAHLGLRHQALRFGRAEVLGAIARAGRDAEQPMADPAEPVTLLAFDRCLGTHDAVLDGTGADELVGAMPPRHMRVAVAYAARLPQPMRRWLVTALPSLPGLAGYAPIFDFEHPADQLMRWHGFRGAEIEALCGEPATLAHTRFRQVFAAYPRTAHYARYSALMEALPCDRLSQAMLMSPLDVRFPFWNPEVQACLRSQPQAHRWQADTPKRILRALLARHLPRPLWDVPKHSFDFPLLDFLAADDFSLVRRYLRQDLWAGWQVFDAARVAQYGRRFMQGERPLGFRVWALVVLAAWLEGHAE